MSKKQLKKNTWVGISILVAQWTNYMDRELKIIGLNLSDTVLQFFLNTCLNA